MSPESASPRRPLGARSPARPPAVTFGLPVRNGAETIGETIASILAQNRDDWELVVSDNGSEDGTTEIVAAFAAEDSRIRHIRPPRLLAQNDNFSETFRHGTGRYFRWIGDDDWVEPDYVDLSASALDNSDAVLCVTGQRLYLDGVLVADSAPVDEGIASPDPVRRVRQLLGLFERDGLRAPDPVYSLARRSAMERTRLMQAYRFGDFIVACELALLGTFVHLPQMLSHRRLAEQVSALAALSRYAGRRDWTKLVQRELSLVAVMQSPAVRLDNRQRLHLAAVLTDFFVRERADGVRRRTYAAVGRRRSRADDVYDTDSATD